MIIANQRRFWVWLLLAGMSWGGTAISQDQSAAVNQERKSSTGGAITGDAITAAACFPDSTVAFLEIARPDQLIQKMAEHDLVAFIGGLEPVRQALRTPQMNLVWIAQGLVESQIGMPLLEALQRNTSGGIYVGADLKSKGVAILIKSERESLLKDLASRILSVVAMGAQQEGRSSPFQQARYRDAVTAKFDSFVVGRYQSWFIWSNQGGFARSIVDRLIDQKKGGLAEQEWYQRARQDNATADLWFAVDLAALRESGINQQLFSGRTTNPGLELIVGGLLDGLQRAPYASGKLEFDHDLSLSLAMPFDPSWASETRQYFFGDALGGAAPQPLQPENVIVDLISFRDLGGWWLSKEDLFDEGVIAQLAQADSQLSTIFSGMDFGQEVLGSLEPGLQLLATQNHFDEGQIPDVQLPAFALVGQMRDPEQIQRRLKIAFQSLIGFANINLGMQGQPQLDLETETIGGARITTAQYYFDGGGETGSLLYNFSPTIAFVGPWFILSSQQDLARELALLAEGKDPAATRTPSVNTRLNLDGSALHRILLDNQESLIAQNMLAEGRSREEGETQIALLLSAMKWIERASIDFEVAPESLRLDLRLQLERSDTFDKSR